MRNDLKATGRALGVASTAPSAITARQDSEKGDFYLGTADQLIAAGLIRAEHLPAPGREWRTLVDGIEVHRHGNHRKDERFLRVQRWNHGLYRVHVGISMEQAKARVAAEQQTRRAEAEARAAAERSQRAAVALDCLKQIPRTADAFRKDLVCELRRAVRATLYRLPQLQGNGYALSDDSLERALLSVDTVVEAILQADVVLDHATHLALVNRYQAQVAAADGGITARLAQLTKPNRALLGLELQP
jgi:hypothetical protein